MSPKVKHAYEHCCIHIVIPYKNENEWTTAIHNTDKPQDNGEEMKVKEYNTEWIHLYRVPKQAQLISGEQSQDNGYFWGEGSKS